MALPPNATPLSHFTFPFLLRIQSFAQCTPPLVQMNAFISTPASNLSSGSYSNHCHLNSQYPTSSQEFSRNTGLSSVLNFFLFCFALLILPVHFFPPSVTTSLTTQPRLWSPNGIESIILEFACMSSSHMETLIISH